MGNKGILPGLWGKTLHLLWTQCHTYQSHADVLDASGHLMWNLVHKSLQIPLWHNFKIASRIVWEHYPLEMLVSSHFPSQESQHGAQACECQQCSLYPELLRPFSAEGVKTC